MAMIQPGTFRMGSPENEPRRDDDEGPVHAVTLSRPFSLGRTEVTFEEWDACVAGGGCNGYRPEDGGWGRGRMPVINVSWSDARAYTTWLSGKTGRKYRLPTEEEWEYAARAGTTTPFYPGATITPDQANFDGGETYNGSRPGLNREKPIAVGSFPANGFGLRDMHGNVWEWVLDCWQQGYPPGGGKGGDAGIAAADRCDTRVLRGGSWSSSPRSLRAADRFWFHPTFRIDNVGFRVLREE